MTSELKVAALQGNSPNFKINLANDSTLKLESDLRLQNQSYLPLPGGDPEQNVFARPQDPVYGSVFMNTRTGKLEYWKHGGKGGWGYIVSSAGDGEEGAGDFLYSWEVNASFTFTSGGRGGSQNDTHTAYSISQLRNQNPYSGQDWVNEYLTTPSYDGVLQWTVPGTGVWEFEVAGARGGISQGYGGNRQPGYGYTNKASFTLNKNDNIMIVVGQQGANNQNGGGGGGSFVFENRNDQYPLMAAGGGGGAGYNSSDGYNSSSSKSGGSVGNCGTSGGSSGGTGGDAYGNGGAGGGWNNYGNTGNDGGNNGQNFRGKRATSRGGFGMGGGGQGGDNGGGGGGGYSGGASGCDGGNGWGGGGGGSYMWTGNPKYAGSSSNIGLNTGSTGGGTGWGYVKVTLKSV